MCKAARQRLTLHVPEHKAPEVLLRKAIALRCFEVVHERKHTRSHSDVSHGSSSIKTTKRNSRGYMYSSVDWTSMRVLIRHEAKTLSRPLPGHSIRLAHSDEIYRQEEAQIHLHTQPVVSPMRGSAASHAHLHPSAMCCADSARGWDSLTSSTRPFYPARSQ